MFMQQPLSIAFRDYLPSVAWDALTKVSHFFRDISSTSINVTYCKCLEASIVKTMCKLEKVFFRSLFDSKEHLLVHLCNEERVSSPLQYNLFEQYLKSLRKKVTNKNHIESSICEAYLIEEMTIFCSFYFDPLLKPNIIVQ